MRNKRRILYITPEISPFTPNTPLSDMSYHLPRIFRNQGHDIRVLTPKYEFIQDRKYSLREVIRLKDIPIPFNGRLEHTSIKSGFIPNTKVQIYFLEHPKYFDRKGIFSLANSEQEYSDNEECSIVFLRSIIEMMKILSWQPEVIHCVDWFSGLLPYYLKSVYGDDDFYQDSKVLLSLNYPSTLGLYDWDVLFKAGINPDRCREDFELAYEDKISLLKGGILFADMFTYPGEASLSTMPEGFRSWFDSYRGENPSRFSTVGYGIDQHGWNPDKDTRLPVNFSHRNLAGKLENKLKLIKKYSLNAVSEGPLVFCIWDELKLSLLKPVMEAIKAAGGGAIVYTAVSEEEVKNFFDSFAGVAAQLKILNSIAFRQLFGGCDLSLFAPTRDSDPLHLKALKYGALPIASNTGLFADDLNAEEGYCYFYESVDAVAGAVENAVNDFSNKSDWEKSQKQAMKLDNSWNKIAKNYLDLYDLICVK